MKKFFLALGMFAVLTSASQARTQIAADKFKHMFAGAGIYGLCVMGGGVLKTVGYENNWLTPLNCLVPVAAAGIAKEVYDRNHPESHTSEFADFAYTMALPVFTATIVYIRF